MFLQHSLFCSQKADSSHSRAHYHNHAGSRNGAEKYEKQEQKLAMPVVGRLSLSSRKRMEKRKTAK